MMGVCVNFINQNNIPPDIADELVTFFNMDVIQKGSLTLKDQNVVYRNLPLSIQVQVSSTVFRLSLSFVQSIIYLPYLTPSISAGSSHLS